MGRLALRCCILACLCAAGAYCSPTLLQTPQSRLALVGSTAEMVCALKGHKIDSLGVYWYWRPMASEELQYIMFAAVLDKSTYYDINFSRDRFTPSRDNFRNQYVLKIIGLQPSDNGTYYCFVSIGTELIFGEGTDLRVVEMMPLTTKVPLTKQEEKRRDTRKYTKVKEKAEDSVCSLTVWVPLLCCNGILLIVLAFTIHCLRRIQRRFRHRFRKQSPS
ncbi:T-cell surface glycoprotein CD8 beta chain [Microcaecilia unicolor]|uniref:T-cell surface glycoprotein CD8 beta chain n=1 Tax=Microcaecilia unicolor TaxID=1415580 RepID=A0A6P7X547_9AMPH|nr:T-cell surface glycoprotein CD8 beta chain [Microcaecilia unicolor]